MIKNIDLHSNEISKFCKENQIRKLSLFGSYNDNTYSGDSDIDIIVEFETIAKPGLLDIARMERTLSEILKLKVDLRTSKELSRHFRNSVVNEAKVVYESI